MKEYTPENIRNIGLVGHGGVGKTTFAEALLFTLGEINRIGKVAEGTTVSDYHADEIERKVSISTTLVHGEWKETKINCLDMPGFSDFIGDTKGSLGVVDLAATSTARSRPRSSPPPEDVALKRRATLRRLVLRAKAIRRGSN